MDLLSSFGVAFMACLTVKNIVFSVIAGIVIGIIAAFIRDEVTHKSHSLIAHVIIGILFAYLGIVCIYGKYGLTLFSIPAIVAGIAGAALGALIVGSAIPGRG